MLMSSSASATILKSDSCQSFDNKVGLSDDEWNDVINILIDHNPNSKNWRLHEKRTIGVDLMATSYDTIAGYVVRLRLVCRYNPSMILNDAAELVFRQPR